MIHYHLLVTAFFYFFILFFYYIDLLYDAPTETGMDKRSQQGDKELPCLRFHPSVALVYPIPAQTIKVNKKVQICSIRQQPRYLLLPPNPLHFHSQGDRCVNTNLIHVTGHVFQCIQSFCYIVQALILYSSQNHLIC